MGRLFLSMALLCAVLVAASQWRGAQAQTNEMTKEFVCRPDATWNRWYNYSCACHGLKVFETEYYFIDKPLMELGVTCPGPNFMAFGRMAFGNPWLESVGYRYWISELKKCANKPYRGKGVQICKIPNIWNRRDLYVGGGYVPRTGKINGRPWTWNPEPPYSNHPRSWTFDSRAGIVIGS
ncbi:hypothetical protein CLOM_g40009 [Closterium sp. NIES-68]|nr:hypothetical protein CLOM_g40009 [Closterium sp. NIES-68]GJP57774.1 hypothetical protein CLOP_g40001 [Closterium sp. NIES-67]GJP84191.1 hypothetical protein CLOP_g40012 [Closterium sp. NIES-67]